MLVGEFHHGFCPTVMTFVNGLRLYLRVPLPSLVAFSLLLSSILCFWSSGSYGLWLSPSDLLTFTTTSPLIALFYRHTQDRIADLVSGLSQGLMNPLWGDGNGDFFQDPPDLDC
jgi:hypothetical protein